MMDKSKPTDNAQYTMMDEDNRQHTIHNEGRRPTDNTQYTMMDEIRPTDEKQYTMMDEDQ
jgi:1,2-phenylacetyl-CoA epoxidase PaaB subunit